MTCTCVETYFRQFEDSFKIFQHHVLFYQELEPALDRKFPEPEPPQNRPAPKPCSSVAWMLNLCLYWILHPLPLFYPIITCEGASGSVFPIQINKAPEWGSGSTTLVHGIIGFVSIIVITVPVDCINFLSCFSDTFSFTLLLKSPGIGRTYGISVVYPDPEFFPGSGSATHTTLIGIIIFSQYVTSLIILMALLKIPALKALTLSVASFAASVL